ncbi:hypothetical protein TorRG33x02_077740 [Trema orientale]|uniref:Uncharacterized protein n=1 Tax=Trema orientale TaxID=63057 RepID=A0A2P5FFD4_TREOI|nr:hypothetical protein TorRG33x02_077740 [Trema orientale]
MKKPVLVLVLVRLTKLILSIKVDEKLDQKSIIKKPQRSRNHHDDFHRQLMMTKKGHCAQDQFVVYDDFDRHDELNTKKRRYRRVVETRRKAYYVYELMMKKKANEDHHELMMKKKANEDYELVKQRSKEKEKLFGLPLTTSNLSRCLMITIGL